MNLGQTEVLNCLWGHLNLKCTGKIKLFSPGKATKYVVNIVFHCTDNIKCCKCPAAKYILILVHNPDPQNLIVGN
jgi:hypothetical protein